GSGGGGRRARLRDRRRRRRQAYDKLATDFRLSSRVLHHHRRAAQPVIGVDQTQQRFEKLRPLGFAERGEDQLIDLLGPLGHGADDLLTRRRQEQRLGPLVLGVFPDQAALFQPAEYVAGGLAVDRDRAGQRYL